MIRRLLTGLLLLPIYFYRSCISPLTPPSCRYTPTCSEYAIRPSAVTAPYADRGLPFAAFCAATLGAEAAMIPCPDPAPHATLRRSHPSSAC